MTNIRSIFIVLCLAMLAACATPLPGSHLIQAGKPMQKIDPGQLGTGAEVYRLSPRDLLLIQVQPLEQTSASYKIEKGNQLRVGFTQAESVKNSYKLVAGDELSLEFPDELEGAYQVLVSPDGKVTLPRIGKSMVAAGLTLSELTKVSTKEYKNLYLTPKLSWAITRAFSEQVSRLAGDYYVGSEGEIVISGLGSFAVLGKSAEQVAAAVTQKATDKFKNEIIANVSVARVNTREQIDNRLTPSGLQMFINPNNLPSRIAEDGTVYISDLGDVMAQGKTIAEFKEELVKKIQPNYQNPIVVNVTVQEYADYSVFIGGEVRQPGRYPFAQKLSLLKLIAMAGWGNDNSDLANVLLLRAGKDNEYTIYRTNLDEVLDGKGPGSQDFRISPQDLIIVPPTGIAKANRFITQYIRGILPFGTNVSYNINQAGINNNQ